jgi:hypothetical protein
MNRPVRYRIQPPPSFGAVASDFSPGIDDSKFLAQQAAIQQQKNDAAMQQNAQAQQDKRQTYWTIYWVLGTASSAACAFHGYRRNKSIGWALWWGLMGGLFPIFAPVLAVAEGFAKPIKK